AVARRLLPAPVQPVAHFGLDFRGHARGIEPGAIEFGLHHVVEGRDAQKQALGIVDAHGGLGGLDQNAGAAGQRGGGEEKDGEDAAARSHRTRHLVRFVVHGGKRYDVLPSRDMALRINRVYTRAGDDGKTALLGGKRVPKDHPRVEAYGCLDELNAIVGLCRAALAAEKKLPPAARRDLDARLRAAQNRLFDCGSVLAAPGGKAWKGMPLPGADDVKALEDSMDAMNRDLPVLKSFVLPGGNPANAWLHHARTACRRAERRAVALARTEPVPPEVIRYLNRLSDWFFVAARHVAARVGAPETLWELPKKKKVGGRR